MRSRDDYQWSSWHFLKISVEILSNVLWDILTLVQSHTTVQSVIFLKINFNWELFFSLSLTTLKIGQDPSLVIFMYIRREDFS